MVDLKKLEHLYEGSILSWDDILKYRTDIPVLERIKKGSDKPCVFVPFMGEFGFFINTYVRFIHYFQCSKKIVCCRPGEEIFFPSADEFIYDWNDFQNDKDRIGANIPGGNKEYRVLKNDFKQKFSGHEIIEIGHEISYRFIQFMPVPLEPFCDKIEVDVVIGPRNRPRDEQRNFPRDKWQKIVDQFKGYRIGLIGQEETSYDFEESVNKSWQYPNPADAMISMLQNCKVFVGTDTGTAHVAAMCGTPMVLFRKKDWSTDFIPFMKQQNNQLVFVENGWETSDQVISNVRFFLKERESLFNFDSPKPPKVCLHIPLHVKDHNHAKMVLEKKRLFKDLRSLDIDTLFTIDRDDIGVDLSDVPHIRLHHPTGIVKPTQEAILYFQSRHGSDCFMMRTGQDVKIDIQGLAKHLDYLRNQGTDQAFLVGDYDKHNDIFGVLREIGINEKQRMFQFVQGNFMSAPMKMWEKYYMHLPSSVTHYKDDSVMSFCLERDGGKLEKIKKFWSHAPKGYFDEFLFGGLRFQEFYQQYRQRDSDVKDLLPIYEKYAKQVTSIVECRDEQYISTLALLSGNPKKMRVYNYNSCPLAEDIRLSKKDVDLRFDNQDSLIIDIEPCELLHLDTKHNYSHIIAELERHHRKVNKFIMIHDTEAFGSVGDDGNSPGVKKAISDFVENNHDWEIVETHKQSNGLMVLKRRHAIEVRGGAKVDKVEVVINNFNRYQPLRKLLDWLINDAEGVGKISIVDNNSDFKPTLDLYQEYRDKIEVNYLGKNMGHNALRHFCTRHFRSNQRFIISDPDLIPAHDCPVDLIPLLNSLLDEYPQAQKAGVGLDLNLPDCYPLKKYVILWEKHLIRGETPCNRGFFCPIDTTFCLVRDCSVWNADGNHIRTKDPYLFAHADWTIDPNNLDEEYTHYYKTANASASHLMKLKRSARFFDSLEEYRDDSNKDRFQEAIVGRKYYVRNDRDNSFTTLQFHSDSECEQWHLKSEYESLSDRDCVIYNSGGSFAYDLLHFSEDFASVTGVTSEGASLSGKLDFDFQGKDDVLKMIVGKQYEMKNEAHNARTTLIFRENYLCEAWHIVDNVFEVLDDRKIVIKYSRGNKSTDVIEFSKDFSEFSGESNRGWKIIGSHRIDD